jgi:hypothetical protein
MGLTKIMVPTAMGARVKVNIRGKERATTKAINRLRDDDQGQSTANRGP